MSDTKARILALKREIIFHYMDLAGMVTIDYNPTPESTKNGLMHTGLVICFYYALKCLDKNDELCFYETVKSCEETPGNYDRYPAYGTKPRNNDANAHDDAAGVFAGSRLTKFRFHRDILNHGVSNIFVYNNQKSGVLVDNINPIKWEWWAFRARFVDHVTWYYLGNEKLRFLTPLFMLWLATKALVSKVGSGRLITYVQVESMTPDSWLWRKFRNWYIKYAKLSESASDYFGEDSAITDIAKLVESCKV